MASLVLALWVGRDEPLPFSGALRPEVADAENARPDGLPLQAGSIAGAEDGAAALQARLEALDQLVEAALRQTLPTARWQRELTTLAYGEAQGHAGGHAGTYGHTGAYESKAAQARPAVAAPQGMIGHPAQAASGAAPETQVVRVYTVTGPCAPLRLGLELLDRLTPPRGRVLEEREKLAAEERPAARELAPNSMAGQASSPGQAREPGHGANRASSGPGMPSLADMADGKIRLAWTDTGHLDIFDRGRLTHRFVFPGREPQLADLARPLSRPALALVIDDMGQSLHAAESLAALPYPVTLAIWPHAPQAQATADLAAQRRLDVLAHVPMEPLPRSDGTRLQPGQGALWAVMQPDQLRPALKDNLSALPSAIGLNNHMGSAFTGNAASCRRLCAGLEGQGFFVLDSLTTPDSHLGAQARSLGLVSATRDVFLDTRRQTPAILEALDHAASRARSKGYAVAIGHPYDETLHALRAWQDKAQVALVPLRRLVWHLAQKDAQQRTVEAQRAAMR
ncbi:MAG: divergent polysaccharide deacetylase family protein [Desulfovibrio sp.]|nr:divergent polysaccharide deacetylase family protein [Desulfovibrio sp.]